jgi:NAD(P)-dependent dehydrogenase (short-subunit alcohol dehydrogenase family)
MPRTVLLTEGDSPLGAALTRLLLGRGCSVVTAVERVADAAAGSVQSAAGSVQSAAEPGASVAVAWNRRSPVSSRTLLLTALNTFPKLDDVLILEPVCAAARGLVEAESAAVEKAFDDARGPVFLAREILSHFRKNGGGVVCMVSRGRATGPVENGMRELFRGMTSALLADAGSGAPVVNGFQQGDADAEEYAAFIDKALEDKGRKISGRWFNCSGRGGLFQGPRLPRRG